MYNEVQLIKHLGKESIGRPEGLAEVRAEIGAKVARLEATKRHTELQVNDLPGIDTPKYNIKNAKNKETPKKKGNTKLQFNDLPGIDTPRKHILKK